MRAPSRLVDRFLSSNLALVGERKHVTVLFADIKGSMELITNSDPEDAQKLLDPTLQLMMDAVHLFEGVVTQLNGDGIMALFGAPIAHEDHTVRAAHAALEIQRDIKLFAARLRVERGVDLNARVGLNSGEVVVRSLHKNLHMEYSAVGDAVHLAARMEQIAETGEVYLTDATRRAIDKFFEVKLVDVLHIKGMREPIQVYRLGEPKQVWNRFHVVALAGGLGPFVGRESEVATVLQAFDSAFKGHGQLVSLVGDAGVGKSRLAYELGRSVLGQGWATMEAQAISYGSRSPYLPIVAMLKAYFGVMPSDGGDAIAGRVSSKLDMQQLLDILPAIFWLFDLEVSDDAWNALDAQVRRQKTIDALKRLLVRVSESQPLLLVFEDLQWIDAETQFVLDAIVELIPATRILLLTTYRPEYDHRWSAKTYYTRVRVDPLPSATAEGLLETLVGTNNSLLPVKRAILQRAEGNPFFIEESVKALIETDALLGERGNYRLGKESKRVTIADSVQAVLAARIDRLLPEEKEVLQAASVIGKDFSLAALHLAIGDDLDVVTASMRKLQHAEFVYETRTMPREYTFKHALTHEVAYAGLLGEQRRNRHAAVLAAIETLHAERLAEHVESLARHAVYGERWEKAVHYLRQAGLSAAHLSAFHESATWHRSALSALDHLSNDRKRIELGIDLRFELYTALLARGDHAPIFEILEKAEQLCLAIEDKKRLARTYGYLAMAWWWAANYGRALEVGALAVSSSRELNHSGLEAVGLVALGWTHTAVGQFDAAIDVLTSVLDFALSTPQRFRVSKGAPLLTVLAHSWLSACHWEKGDFEKGRHHADEAIELADQADHPWSQAAAYYTIGTLLTRQGKAHEAVPILERGLAICTNKHIDAWRTSLKWVLGHALALAGAPGRGTPLLEQAVEESAADKKMCLQSLRVAWLAESELIGGNVARAEQLSQEALGLAQQYGERGAEAHVYRILRDVSRANAEDIAVPISRYEKAIAIAKQLSMRPLEARCHFAVGELLSKRNDKAASGALTTAAAMFASMGISTLTPSRVAVTD